MCWDSSFSFPHLLPSWGQREVVVVPAGEDSGRYSRNPALGARPPVLFQQASVKCELKCKLRFISSLKAQYQTPFHNQEKKNP